MVAGKYILAGVAASMLGILMNPEMMAASNSVMVTRLDTVNSVETMVEMNEKGEFTLALEEAAAMLEAAPEAQATLAETSVAAPDNSARQNTGAQVVRPTEQPQPAQAMPANSLRILGNTIELRWTGTTDEDAGAAKQGWLYTGGKFIYAHDYDYVLGVLNTAHDRGTLVGTQFSVTIDGVTRQYTVAEAKVYTYNAVSWRMAKLVQGDGHALALMTCYGDSRLVVLAD